MFDEIVRPEHVFTENPAKRFKLANHPETMATAIVTTPPPLRPISQTPSAKERKYDRQLRLWAANGQAALENAKVALLNSGSGALGAETLKNIILPGIGSFTIVDDQVVKAEDLGVNFFLSEECIGKSKAEEMCRYLKELNPGVAGNAVNKGVHEFIEDSKNLASFDLILVCAPMTKIDLLADQCRSLGVPLVYMHSLGFYSHISLQIPENLPVVETHPDAATTQDLRLLKPWPEILELMHEKTDHLDNLSDHEHGHVPYLLILLRELEQWKAKHEGHAPTRYDEKKEIQSIIRQQARTNNPEGGEENFEEAASAVLKTLTSTSVKPGLQAVFDHHSCQSPSAGSAKFWIIAHAISQFHARFGQLPLPGSIPDMKAQSVDYIRLQNVYKAKAKGDIEQVIAFVREMETRLDRTEKISISEVDAFCRNAAHITLLRGGALRFPISKPVSQEGQTGHFPDEWTSIASSPTISTQFLMPKDSLLPTYLAFLAYDRIMTDDSSLIPAEAAERAINPAKSYLRSIATQTACEVSSETLLELENQTENVLGEFARADGAELHNISSLAGGIAAQEVIKLITKQYIPVDNVCVFDGIASKTATFHM